MTPADHYVEAERRIERARTAPEPEEQTYHLAVAQVHATLATAEDPDALWPREWIAGKGHPEYIDITIEQATRLARQGCRCSTTSGVGNTSKIELRWHPECPVHGHNPPLQPKGSTGEVRMEGAD